MTNCSSCHYGFSNHLGNVLAVITDKKIPRDDDGNDVVDYYVADVVSATDYSPFGARLYGRDFNTSEYRFSFQGQEHDDEIKGGGNSVNYKFRMYDTRLGRFLAIDPLADKYPFWSPYSFSGNQVIHAQEFEGLESSENLNQSEGGENQTTGEIELDEFVLEYKRGDKGDWIGARPDLSKGELMTLATHKQAETFAETTNSEFHQTKDGVEVKICRNSVLGMEIFRQLEMRHGLTEKDLSHKEANELLTLTWNSNEDKSYLFWYTPPRIIINGVMVMPTTIPVAVPVLLPPGASASGSGEIFVDASLLAKDIVDNFSKVARGKNRETEWEHVSDEEFDELYEQEMEKLKGKAGRTKKGKARKRKLNKEQKMRGKRKKQKRESEKGSGSGRKGNKR